LKYFYYITLFFVFTAAPAKGEVQTSLSMSLPNLVMGASGLFSASQVSGPAGTNNGTVLHSYAGVMDFTQTSGTGRLAGYNGVTRFGVGFDTFQLFQSFIDPNYFTIVSSGTTCPVTSTYNWMMVRWRTADAPRQAMSAADPDLSAGGTFNYTAGNSTFTGVNFFNLVGPTLNSSLAYSVAGFSGAVCAAGKNLAQSAGGSSIDQYLYVYYGANNIAMVTSNGNPQVMVAVPQSTLSSAVMTSLSTYVMTGLYTEFTNSTAQNQKNIYLYPDASGTVWTLRTETSLTDPSQFTTLGTLSLPNLNLPTTGFVSGSLQLLGVPGIGNAVCLISPSSSENLMMCSAQYPSTPAEAVTIIGKTVNQSVLQVTLPALAASVANSGQTATLTATVKNLSSRYAPTIGNPSDPMLDLTAPWSNSGAFGGGSGTCGTSLNAYASCTFPVTYTSPSIGTNSSLLRVAYDNGTGLPANATGFLVGTTGLSNITVTPASEYVGSGTNQQLTATATYSDGSTQNVSAAANWSSSNQAIGTISSSGLASWLSNGATSVSANIAGISGSANYTSVTPPVLTSISNQVFPSSNLTQGVNFSFDFNNVSGGLPGNDTNMTYSCTFDKVVDGSVGAGAPCSSLPGTFSLNATGIFSWTPNNAFGPYEIQITGTLDSTVSSTEIFVADVRQGYVLSNLRGDYQAQFANLTTPYTSPSFYWRDLTANNFDGTSSSSLNATWTGGGTGASPYALLFNGAALMDYGASIMAAQTKIMFSMWLNPVSAASTDQVILGDNTDGIGNGFTLRQAKNLANHLDFSVGNEGATVATYQATILADSPTAYWRLGESSGSVLADSSGNGHSLSISGTGQTLNQAGAIASDTNGSLQVTGTSYACMASGPSLTGTFSVEAWVYPSTSGTLGIVGSRKPSDDSFDFKSLGGAFHGDIGTGSAWLSTAADTAASYGTLNTWYHVVYVVTPTGYSIYVNATLAGSGSWASAVPVLFDSTHTLCLAADGISFEEFIGKIDEVAIYNYALTSAQIATHFNTGTAPGAAICQSVSSISSNQWTSVSGIYDGSTAYLFLNGRPECTIAINNSLTTPLTDLVAASTASATNAWTGSLSQLQIYGATGATTVGTAANVYTDFSSTADTVRLFPLGNVVTSGLVLSYDAANAASGVRFPGIGIGQISWFDLTSNFYDGVLTNFSGAANSEWVGSGTTTSPYALAFDGTASYVTTPYTQTNVTGYTVEVWVKTTDAGTERTFVQNRGSGAGKSLTFGIGVSGGGHGGPGLVHMEADSNTLDVGISSTTAVNDGNWHHVVGTWSASSGTAVAPSQFSIYIDDNLAGTTSGATGSATSPLTGLSTVLIGHHNAWGSYFAGQLAKVAIYNRALTAAEVKQNCSATVGRFSGGICH
jgi:hypothetical protein